ncbi:Protease Do-like 14-like protein [Heracleum sosnowskyi]|uniref:Protease Do-like 14-like protein n=1 Tax=Heracleum sosnowskyi TaxID=360622 RepID=A0AAD8GPW8_9APIA|nr:Protease Do-like 14-like protein [Heracleum sosnowskyi]
MAAKKSGRKGRCRYKYVINNYGRFGGKLDKDTKKSVLKAASTVVCLTSYSGDKQMFICSGFIMESCDNGCGTFTGTILTSAILLRSPSGADDLKIDVYMAGGAFFKGQLLAVDFHYNIAIITINSNAPLPTSTVRLIDKSVPLDPGNRGCFEDLNLSHFAGHQDSAISSNRFSLYPGTAVLALGRYFADSYDIMAAPGEFSYGDCKFDCKELLISSCKIKKNGMGGPLINSLGEVIGVNFYKASYTPFLPMNIVCQCYRDLKTQCRIPRPWIGLSVVDLFGGSLHELEILNQKFPQVVEGAIVKQALPNSPACIADLRAGDVIINCDGNLVRSCLELTEALWDKEGKPVELVVVRESADKPLSLVVEAVKTNPNTYRWPVPERRVVNNHPLLRERFIWSSNSLFPWPALL